MRFVSFEKDKEIKVGLELLDQGIIDLIHLDSTIPNNLNDIIKNFSSLVSKIKILNSPNNIHYKADEVRILAPIPVPVRDIICVGKNYAEHAKEVQRSSFKTLQGKQAVPTKPIIFNKATTSVIGPHDKIETKNDETKTTDYEGELELSFKKEQKM